MKYAIILPGNLATYFTSLDTFKLLCDNYDIDIYILYSNKVNYIHTLFKGNTIVSVDCEDIIFINEKLKNNIKFFKPIEDISDYNDILNKYIDIFKKNIIWTKELHLMHQFNYIDFNNNNRTIFYLDQFVRMNYLYNIIKQSNINYDYIIRARIDQFIDYNILSKTCTFLDKTMQIYPIITSNMDNFFIIGKTHFDFFNYIVQNIGSSNLKYHDNYDKYVLGPEYQFRSLVNSYFDCLTDFLQLNVCIEMTFSIIDKDFSNFIIYTSKNNNGICFDKYKSNLEINNYNYTEIFLNDSSFSCVKCSSFPKKFQNYIFMFYAII